jgi:DNA polymerase-3 subunit alpha
MSFVHLHAHSYHSLMDGLQPAIEMGPTVAKRGMSAVALTDHGYMGGIVEFVKGCKTAGVKPIIGCETYLAYGSALEKSTVKIGNRNASSGHFLLLATNAVGYRNLCTLTHYAYTQGFYSDPRIDFDILRQHNEGLVCTSTCLSSHMATYFKEGLDVSYARTWIDNILDIFGRDRFFFEVQVNNVEIQRKYNDEWVVPLSKEYGIPLVLTADAHHQNQDIKEWKTRGLVQCIGWKQQPHATKYEIKDYNAWLYDEQFALSLARSWNLPDECVTNTSYVADMVQIYEFERVASGGNIDFASDITPEEKLKSEIVQGVVRNLKLSDSSQIPQPYVDRMKEEFRIINDFGYSSYFLIVQDYINFAKSQNIPVGPGRGSAGGSLIAWALGITSPLLDPIKYDLYFTRFLNPGRVHAHLEMDI